MDQTGENFYYYVDTIINILGSTPTVLQLPIGFLGEFVGAIDLITIEAIFWHGEDLGTSFDLIPLEECNSNDSFDNSLKAKVVEYRDKILDLAVGINKEILI